MVSPMMTTESLEVGTWSQFQHLELLNEGSVVFVELLVAFAMIRH